METVLFWVVATLSMMFCALIVTYKIWLWAFLRRLAERNIVVTIVQEGTGKLIMKNGKAFRFITAHAGTGNNDSTDPDEFWDITQHGEDKSRDEGKKDISPLETRQAMPSQLVNWIDQRLLPGGMRWVGFKFLGYELYEYNFRWEVLRSSEPSGEEDGLVRKRQLLSGKWVASFAKRIDYVYTKDAVYYLELIGAETKGLLEEAGKKNGKVAHKSVGMPVNISMVMTARVVNPYRALIFIHDWLESTFDLVRPVIRKWVADNLYEDVIGKPEIAERAYDVLLQQNGVTDELLDKVDQYRLPGDKIDREKAKQCLTYADYIELAYGVRVKRISFDEVIPPEEYTKAASQRAIAEQNKIRIQTEAEAEKERLSILGEGEAARLTKVNLAIQEGGGTALALMSLETMEKVAEYGNLIVVSDSPGNVLLNVAGQGRGAAWPQKMKELGSGQKPEKKDSKSSPPSSEE